MKTVDFIRESVSGLNETMMADVKDLTPQQLAWKPAAKANPIGFLFWHFMRTQDNYMSGLRRSAALWESEGWQAKASWDIDSRAQGTGFQEAEVDKTAALPLSLLMGYAARVARVTDEYIGSLDDAKLDEIPDPSRPRRTIAAVLRSFIIAHGWWHAGEIRYLKGMLGMPAER